MTNNPPDDGRIGNRSKLLSMGSRGILDKKNKASEFPRRHLLHRLIFLAIVKQVFNIIEPPLKLFPKCFFRNKKL